MVTLMMERVSTSETSIHFYETKRHYSPEGYHLHTHRREHLKSHSALYLSVIE
jgi:hypothetical protein